MNPTKLMWVKWVAHRMNRNKNLILCVNGPTGSGKSYAAIDAAYTLACAFETNFCIKYNVAFKFNDLLQKMYHPPNDKPKTCFVMEEIGAFGSGGSSREWQSHTNKFFFSFLQTSRHKNQILILTTPNFAYLDAGARKLIHFQFESSGINYTKKTSIFKPYRLQVNQRTGKIYFKFLRIAQPNGRIVKLKYVEFELPPPEMVAQYEAEKTKFTSQLNKDILLGSEKKPKGVPARVDKDRVMEYFKEKVPLVEIARRFGVSYSYIVQLKKKSSEEYKRIKMPIPWA